MPMWQRYEQEVLLLQHFQQAAVKQSPQNTAHNSSSPQSYHAPLCEKERKEKKMYAARHSWIEANGPTKLP